jgi:hypothetical protein
MTKEYVVFGAVHIPGGTHGPLCAEFPLKLAAKITEASTVLDPKRNENADISRSVSV